MAVAYRARCTRCDPEPFSVSIRVGHTVCNCDSDCAAERGGHSVSICVGHTVCNCDSDCVAERGGHILQLAGALCERALLRNGCPDADASSDEKRIPVTLEECVSLDI